MSLEDFRTSAAVRFGMWASVGAAPVLLLTLLLAFWIQGEIAKREMKRTFEDLGDPPPFNPSPPGPGSPAPGDLLRNPPIRLPGG